MSIHQPFTALSKLLSYLNIMRKCPCIEASLQPIRNIWSLLSLLREISTLQLKKTHAKWETIFIILTTHVLKNSQHKVIQKNTRSKCDNRYGCFWTCGRPVPYQFIYFFPLYINIVMTQSLHLLITYLCKLYIISLPIQKGIEPQDFCLFFQQHWQKADSDSFQRHK